MAKTKDKIKALEAYCQDSGARLTESRRLVFQIVAEAKKPLGAYDILDALRAHIDNPKPPTAYRAIEFLAEHGFIHRIESLNAYITCHAGHRHQGSQYMICDSCGAVQEMHLCSIPDALKKKADEQAFNLSYWNTELHGLCGECA